MAKLVILTKGLTGLSHELTLAKTTIGRAEGNIIQILDPSVSGRHCEILLRGDDVVVRDLQSTNGTFIKGEKITEAVLKLGQIMRLGQVDLRLLASAAAASPAPAAPAAPAPMPAAALPVVPKPTPPPPPAPAPSSTAALPTPKGRNVDLARSAAPPAASPASPAAKLESAANAPKPPGSAPRHQVLFVDDSAEFLQLVTELYAIQGDKTWDIHCAATADQAFAILQEKKIDLVVLDIGMPVLDGMQLLGLIHRRYPDLKKAILTGSVSDSNRAACLANGAELFFQKPFSSDGMKAVFTTLNELITWAQRDGFSGMLRQVGLQDVIQMECLGRNSSILEVRNQNMQGLIYIEGGMIVHATAGTLVGEKAFYRLLSLTGGEFHLQPFKKPAERTVQGGWEFLLMESARIHDEEATTLVTRPVPPAAPDHEVPAMGEDIVVVATYDGKWHPADGPKKTP